MTSYLRHLTQGDKVTSVDLKVKWAETLSFFDQRIEGGHQLRSVRFLILHIIEKGYDNFYFPGTSLFNLLISIPIDNKVNYMKTLKIEVDQLSNIVKFNYRDLTGLNRDDNADFEKSLKWSEACQLSESIDTFEYFISKNDEWKATTK